MEIDTNTWAVKCRVRSQRFLATIYAGARSMDMEQNQTNKRVVWDFWRDLETADDRRLTDVARLAMHDDVEWNGPDPIGQLHGVGAFISEFWLPLRRSFPDITRQTHVFFGGESNGRADGDLSLDGHMWVTGTGVLTGTFAGDYLRIPATGGEVTLPWGEFCRLEDGVIVEVYFLIDLVEVMRQAGYEVLPPSRGAEGVYPPPATASCWMFRIRKRRVTVSSTSGGSSSMGSTPMTRLS